MGEGDILLGCPSCYAPETSRREWALFYNLAPVLLLCAGASKRPSIALTSALAPDGLRRLDAGEGKREGEGEGKREQDAPKSARNCQIRKCNRR